MFLFFSVYFFLSLSLYFCILFPKSLSIQFIFSFRYTNPWSLFLTFFFLFRSTGTWERNHNRRTSTVKKRRGREEWIHFVGSLLGFITFLLPLFSRYLLSLSLSLSCSLLFSPIFIFTLLSVTLFTCPYFIRYWFFDPSSLSLSLSENVSPSFSVRSKYSRTSYVCYPLVSVYTLVLFSFVSQINNVYSFSFFKILSLSPCFLPVLGLSLIFWFFHSLVSRMYLFDPFFHDTSSTLIYIHHSSSRLSFSVLSSLFLYL